MKERKRNRKAGFDYSSQGIYFLTICCQNRISYFGKIHTLKMELNEYGNILNGQIEWMEQQYPYFIIHNYIIMPNHIHILAEISLRDRGESFHPIEMDGAWIDGDSMDSAIDGDAMDSAIDGDSMDSAIDGDAIDSAIDGDAMDSAIDGDAMDSAVRTGRDLSLHCAPEIEYHPQKIKSISELMGALKTTSSKKIHLAGNLQFQWQRSFHDHIVKSENAYWNIYNYITKNPEKWGDDKFFNLD